MNKTLSMLTVATACIAIALTGCQGCSKTEAAADAAPAVPVKRFTGMGVTFELPTAFKAELVTDNPELHQIAVGQIEGAGIQLVLRHFPKKPNTPLDLEAITAAEKKGLEEGREAVVTPGKVTVAGKQFDARILKAAILGFPQTDTIAVPEIGGRHYLLIMHAADEDADKAKVMFDKVLSTIGPG